MKLLLDECIPWKVKFLFTAAGHACDTVRDAGLSGEENGELLALIENQFDVSVWDRAFSTPENLRELAS
jgi:predicted nuclease of predicted toxin-antitoxin system